MYRRDYEYGFRRQRVEADIFFGNPTGHGIPTGCGVGVVGASPTKFDGVFLVKHLAKRCHLTCFEIKNLADLRSLPFPLSSCLPCTYLLCQIADSVLGNIRSCSVDPGHLFFSLIYYDSYSSRAVHLPKILPVSPAAASLVVSLILGTEPLLSPFLSSFLQCPTQ